MGDSYNQDYFRLAGGTSGGGARDRAVLERSRARYAALEAWLRRKGPSIPAVKAHPKEASDRTEFPVPSPSAARILARLDARRPNVVATPAAAPVHVDTPLRTSRWRRALRVAAGLVWVPVLVAGGVRGLRRHRRRR